MKHLKNPKILIPVVLVLIALGAFATTQMSGTSDNGVDPELNNYGGHGHSH